MEEEGASSWDETAGLSWRSTWPRSREGSMMLRTRRLSSFVSLIVLVLSNRSRIKCLFKGKGAKTYQGIHPQLSDPKGDEFGWLQVLLFLLWKKRLEGR